MSEENKAMQIADFMANVMRPSSSPDQEVLNVVAKYSLQIRPDQQLVLNRLYILAKMDLISDEQKNLINDFIEEYQSTKRYHDTLPYIGKTVEALSLRRFWSMDSMKGNVMKQQQG